MNKLRINMLSKADSVDGQGVGSAYLEQVALLKEAPNDFEITINGKGKKYDIFHIHSVNPSFFFKLKRYGKKIPFVTYVHFLPTTLDGSIKLDKLSFSVFKKYVVKLYKTSNEIVVVNPIFIKPLVELGINEERITYIPNYVSKEQFYKLDDTKCQELKNKYGINNNKFTVLGVGQIQNRKGVMDFINVAIRHPEMNFVWAGGFSFGMITDGYHELKKIYENPPENVKFLGIVPRKEMNEVFNIADVLFMPSYNELFPMSILEAVNVGIPVVLRDLELYEDILFAKYLKGENNDEFSALIEALSTNKEFYNKACEYSSYISAYYSKDHVLKLWKEYYNRIYTKYQKRGSR